MLYFNALLEPFENNTLKPAAPCEKTIGIMNYKGIRVTWGVRNLKDAVKKNNVLNNLILFCNHIGASPKSGPSKTYSALTTLTC